MKKANAKAEQISTSGKSKPTQRTAAEVHAEALRLGLDVHSTGEVLHRNVSDSNPMNFVWGCAFGHSLVIDAVHAIRLNAELGFSPEEGIQNLLRDAFKHLEGSPVMNGEDRKGLAVGAIYTIASLAAHAINLDDALSVVEGLRDEAVELAVSADIEHAQGLKARAMAGRAAKQTQAAAA